MNKSLLTLLLVIALGLLPAACAGPSPSAAPLAAETQPAPGQSARPAAGQPVLNRDALSAYSAEFLLQFGGSYSWNYLLKTRKAANLREVSLHMEGLDAARNPGDVRLVTDGAQSWMTGEGTGGECVQFPNRAGMDPTFIYPETILSLAEAGPALELVGEEVSDTGVVLEHYRAGGARSGPWQNASIDLWQDKVSGMLHRLTIQAQGEDPFFGAGKGNVAAYYRLTALDEPAIEPVTGCEISVRLPEAVSQFVRLPGMASFAAGSDPQAVQQFYQAALPQDGWEEAAPPEQVDGAVVLSYRRGAEDVQIVIEPGDAGGSLLKVLTLPAAE